MATTCIETKAEHKLGFVDLTLELRDAVAASRVEGGLAVVFCRHTTCAVVINEWEDGAQEDIRDRLLALVPEDAYFAHDDMTRRTQNLQDGPEPANGHAHVLHVLLGASSQVIPIEGGEPALGRWQRLMLLELDEPRARSVTISVVS